MYKQLVISLYESVLNSQHYINDDTIRFGPCDDCYSSRISDCQAMWKNYICHRNYKHIKYFLIIHLHNENGNLTKLIWQKLKVSRLKRIQILHSGPLTYWKLSRFCYFARVFIKNTLDMQLSHIAYTYTQIFPICVALKLNLTNDSQMLFAALNMHTFLFLSSFFYFLFCLLSEDFTHANPRRTRLIFER